MYRSVVGAQHITVICGRPVTDLPVSYGIGSKLYNSEKQLILEKFCEKPNNHKISKIMSLKNCTHMVLALGLGSDSFFFNSNRNPCG